MVVQDSFTYFKVRVYCAAKFRIAIFGNAPLRQTLEQKEQYFMFCFLRSLSFFVVLSLVLTTGVVMAQEDTLTEPTVKPSVLAANPIPNASTFIPPAPDLHIAKGKTELISVRMLSVRPTGAGGVQPFKVRDVRDVIDPERRIMLAAFGANCDGDTDSTQSTSSSFVLPANGTICTFPPSSSTIGNTDVVFILTGFTPTSATLVPQNGWTVTPTAVMSDDINPVDNNITISKNGVTHSLILSVFSDQVTPGEGTGSINSFMRF